VSITLSMEHSREAIELTRDAMTALYEAIERGNFGVEEFSNAVTFTSDAIETTAIAITRVGQLLESLPATMV
jgi:hypothetical protein